MQMARAPEVPKSSPRYSFCELDCAEDFETFQWRDDFCLLFWNASSFTRLTDPRDPVDIQRVSSVTQVNAVPDGQHLMLERRQHQQTTSCKHRATLAT